MTIMHQSYDFDDYNIMHLLRRQFGKTVFKSYARILVDKLQPDQTIIELVGLPLMAYRVQEGGGDYHKFYFKADETSFLEVSSCSRDICIAAFSTTMEELGPLKQIEEKLRQLALTPSDRETSVNFMSMDGDGISQRAGVIEALPWAEIRNNYIEKNRLAFDRLLAMEEPWKRGKLLLVHGAPGTGKTTFIRTLMKEWKKRFTGVVIADPEHFTAQADYYFQSCSKIARARDEDGEKIEGPKQNLFIMEDCADLVMPESRQIHYDKMGKFLSMTDGLFGQGRRDLFVLTFNEEIDRIDSAFTRPGRCLANIKLEHFGPEEQTQWLKGHGIDPAVVERERDFRHSKRSLAELYELYHLHHKETP